MWDLSRHNIGVPEIFRNVASNEINQVPASVRCRPTPIIHTTPPPAMEVRCKTTRLIVQEALQPPPVAVVALRMMAVATTMRSHWLAIMRAISTTIIMEIHPPTPQRLPWIHPPLTVHPPPHQMMPRPSLPTSRPKSRGVTPPPHRTIIMSTIIPFRTMAK